MTSRQQDKLLQALLGIGQELASTRELAPLLARVLDVSRELFHFENAIIRLLDAERGVLVTSASYGYSEEAAQLEIRVGEGVIGTVARTGTPLLVTDIERHPEYLPGISGARSELAVPLVARDRLIGVFNVEGTRPDAFSEADVAPLMILAGQTAIAIENARLYEDLSDMSQRFQTLHQFNERILRSVNIGIYTVDREMVITSWNPRMVELSGVAADAAIGRPLLTLFPTLEDEGVAARLRRVLRTGKAEKVRLLHRNQHGEMRFQKRRLAPLKEEGETTGAAVMVEDVTEFRKLLDQIVQSEKLVEVGRLSAGIAHEVNNPLAVISYAAQLLQREGNLSEDQQELVERIGNEVERLQALTGSLLSFSRAQETLKRKVDLNDIVTDVLRLVRYDITRKGIALSESYGPALPVSGDPNKLKQVIINLIMNATQAVARGGRIDLSTAPVAGDEVELVIRDDGPGIPADVLERIFEPFFTTKKAGEGTGLGLYICRNIVAEHDGRLLAESAPGEGATFRLVLPVVPAN